MNQLIRSAETAISHVTNEMSVQTGIPAGNIIRESSGLLSGNTIGASQSIAGRRPTTSPLPIPDVVTTSSRSVQSSMVGNGGDQTAKTFDYLRNHGGHRIAWILLPKYNHTLIVLGLKRQPPQTSSFRIGNGPPASWGPNAVICDPQYHQCFEVRAGWDKKISQILTATSGRTVTPGVWCKFQCRAYIN